MFSLIFVNELVEVIVDLFPFYTSIFAVVGNVPFWKEMKEPVMVNQAKFFPSIHTSRNSLLIGKCLGDSYSLSLLYSMRINGEEEEAATFRLFQCCSKNWIETNQWNSHKASWEVRDPTQLCWVSLFVVKPLFAFLSFIGPFTKKGAILCSQLTRWLVNFVRSGPVQVVAL